jgi:hypothetical protein
MAATTLQIWNPGQVNQDTDSQYEADPQRTGGAVDDTAFPSLTANKLFNQMSGFLFSLFTAFAQKGFATDDANISTLTAVCANFLTTADLLPNVQVVAYSPTPAFNAALTNGFQMTLAGNITASTISGVAPGQLVAFYFVQDGTGGRTVAWPSSMTGTVQPDPTPNAISLILFRADLSSVLHAVAPLVSNNGVFSSNTFSTDALTLTTGAQTGAFLVGNGNSFLGKRRLRRTPANVFGTVYQNTTTAQITVYVTSNDSGGGGTQNAYVGTTNPPTLNVGGSSGPAGGGVHGLVFEVLAGEYYKVVNDVGSLNVWIECYYA